MNVFDSVKRTIGIEEQPPAYECQSCGREFRTEADVEANWYVCTKCDGTDIRPLKG